MWRRNALGTTIMLTLLAAACALTDHRSSANAEAISDVKLRINPNVATAGELMLLPGIGPRLAEEIIAYRTRAGGKLAFTCEADLDAVTRIGSKTIERLRPFLRFDRPKGEESAP